jgi:hypothetical protein
MSKSELNRARKAWPWLILLVLFLAGMGYLIVLHLGSSVTASAVIELDKDLISTNGLMIAFTGIIFTGMLAEIRFRTERAIQASDQRRADRLERTSKALRKTALLAFLFFAASLAVAIGNLPDPLSSPSSSFSLTATFVFPVALMVGGLVNLMIALAIIASE